MRLSTRALSLIIVIIITGCISIRPRQEPLPDWVKSAPVDSTYFYGVGIGKASTPALARRIAEVCVRADIARSVEVHIRELQKLILSLIDTKFFTPDFPPSPRYPDFPSFDASVLRGVTIVKQHIHSEGDSWRFYVLARVSIDSVYEAFLEWVRPLAPPEYYDLLVELLKKRGHK